MFGSWMRMAAVACACAVTAGCVPPGAGPAGAGYVYGESRARAARFAELSAMNGLPPPSITEVAAPQFGPGGGTPVVVVVFDESSLFASGSAQPNPNAGPLFDVVSTAMSRDSPSAQLTLLGHTDAVGSDATNDALSLRRARAVLGALLVRQVNGAQLSTVAIGRRQPLAPNATDSGRARNRRVEFLVSVDGDANLAVIGARPIRADWLATGAGQRSLPSSSVAVLRPSEGAQGGEASLQESKKLVLQPAR